MLFPIQVGILFSEERPSSKAFRVQHRKIYRLPFFTPTHPSKKQLKLSQAFFSMYFRTLKNAQKFCLSLLDMMIQKAWVSWVPKALFIRFSWLLLRLEKCLTQFFFLLLSTFSATERCTRHLLSCFLLGYSKSFEIDSDKR